MDIKKLQAVLMSKGIRVSADDPVFTLVALNEAVLEEMTRNHQYTLKNKPLPLHSGTLQISTAANSLKTAVFCAIAFGAGAFFGTKNVSFLLPGAIGVACGMLAGSVLCYLVILHAEMKIQNRPEQVVDHTTLNSRWTENEFQSAAVNSALSQRTLKACRDVLVGGMTVPEAAVQHLIWTASVQLGLKKLKRTALERADVQEQLTTTNLSGD